MRKVILLFIFFFSVLASQAQLTEGFEGGTFPPTGWLLNPAAGNTWETATNGAAGGDDAAINPFTVNPHSGTGMARFRSYDFSSGTSAELISSVINLSAGGPHVVKFWFHQDNGYASNLDSVAVYINTTQSFTGATRINKVSRPIASPAQQWNQFSFNIPASFNTTTNYIIFKAYSRFGNNMFIDDVSVESAPSCISPTVAVVPGNTTAALSWGTVTGATGYEWAVTTSATPPASGTATGATSANATGLTAVTQYYAHVRTACGASFSAWTTVQFKTSFDCSTAEVISACGVSKTASLSGTGVYNITACGFSTPGTEKLYSFTPTVSGNYTLNITAANGEWIDYFYKAASGGCGETGWTCIDDNNAVGTDVFGPLTAGVTYYILLDPEDASVTSTATFDLICPAVAPPPCTTNLTPTNGATGVSPVTLTWNAAAGATGYNVFFGTTNPPTANIGSTTATTANITGTLPGTTYYWYVQPTNTAGGATGCETSTFSFTTANAPVNDTACGAIVLTQGGPQDCKSTTTATSVGDPSLSCGTPNNTLWYRYTPATNGTVLARLEIPGASTSPLNGWLAWYTATGTCPSPPGLTLTQLGSCSEFGQTGAGDVDTLVSPVLTAGTTYYIMIDGVVGDAGDFCINLLAPPPPPPCTANITPTNGATGVTSVAGNVALTWTVSPGATSYDVYFGTTNPPTTNIGNTTSNTVNITGTSYNTTYYWYVVPRNTGGPATGCQTNTTSFTTENPTNCVPSYTTGCTLADSIIYFSLKGNSGTVIYNYSSGFCNTTAGQRGYSDYSGGGFYTPPVLSRNESYAGVIQTGDPNDYITIWIDGNDNGFFEDSERLISNLKASTTRKLFSLYIPASMPLGQHRMRVRSIYSGITPTTLTHPCNPYTWGETEDYTVEITNVGSSGRLAAPGNPGSCVDAGVITINAASNNLVIAPVYIVDSLNNYICAIYPQGNNLGTVTPTYYVHNGPVRQDVTGRYYLDRNISIGVETQPVNPYNLRYFFRNSELNALIAQPGSGVTSVFDLVMTKTNGPECVTQYVQQSPVLVNPTGFGSLNGDRFLDLTNLTGFSRFFLHGGSSVLLPVTLTNLYAKATGTSNTVYWNTEQEQNNRKFVVERSANGRDFTSIGEVNSQAINGNSSVRLSYSFADAAPLEGKSFYRLKVVDLNDRQTATPVVTVQRGKGQFEITDVRPSPTSGLVYFNLVGGSTGATVVVRSMNGQEVLRKQFNEPAAFSINLGGLSNGMYMLEATDREGRKAVYKVVKQ